MNKSIDKTVSAKNIIEKSNESKVHLVSFSISSGRQPRDSKYLYFLESAISTSICDKSDMCLASLGNQAYSSFIKDLVSYSLKSLTQVRSRLIPFYLFGFKLFVLSLHYLE